MEIETIDERGGYFFEALLDYTINHYCKKVGCFEMHKRLTEHSVVSDVIIPSADNPRAVILCTHSQSEKGTAMKTWRNIDEMILIREKFPECAIINLIFPSKWKAELLLLMGGIADRQILFPNELIASVRLLVSKALKERMRTAEEYKSWISEYDCSTIRSITRFLGTEIDSVFLNNEIIRPEWDGFSKSVNESQNCIIHYFSDNAYKKGFCRLALLSDELRESLLNNQNNISNLDKKSINNLTSVGVVTVREGIVKEIQIEATVKDVLRHNSRILRYACELVRKYYGEDWNQLITMVRSSETFGLQDFVSTIQSCEVEELERYLFSVLTEWRDHHSGERNVPLSYLYVIARALNKRFSHETLSQYCNLPMIGGISPIPMFLYGKKPLSDEKVRTISEYFSRVIKTDTLPDITTLWGQLLYETEDKLIKHRHVNFLIYSAIAKCLDSGIEVYNVASPEILIGNGISDYWVAKEVGISSGTAQTHFSFKARYNGKDIVFLVISANAATHKHKEYPARWRCANIKYTEGRFIYKRDSDKWIVILDGAWKSLFADFSDVVDKFASAGADALFDIGTFLDCEDLSEIFDKITE